MRLFRILLPLFPLMAVAHASDLTVRVVDQSGNPVNDAVVYALPVSGGAPVRKAGREVVQRDRQFVPYVSAVQTGSLVQFPNKDNVKHHVYSFSPVKKFELPLYAGTPTEPIRFDQSGLVTLGCNIHDWMIAYILVIPTPWSGVTNAAGAAQLRDLPSGSYDVEVWQPRLKNASDRPRQSVAMKTKAVVNFQLDLKPDFRLRRSPADFRDGYR